MVFRLICVVVVAACTGPPRPGAQRLTLDVGHDYGDLFADGKLPVGDGKIVTDGARGGYVYACPVGMRRVSRQEPPSVRPCAGPGFRRTVSGTTRT